MAGAGGGVATPPTPKTRGSFEWFQRRRAKWEQAPRPKVISLSSPKPKPTTDSKHVSPKKATSTAASLSFTPVSVDAKERSETQSQHHQQQQRQQQQGPFSSGATSTAKTTTTIKITDVSAKKPLPPNKPAATQPKPNPFANISLVPSSSSPLSLQSASTTSDTLKTGNASKPPVFGGLSSMSSSSPFTSFGSKPAATQSSFFGEAGSDFSFAKSSNPTTVPTSSNLFGGGLFSATPATAKPSASTKSGISSGPNTTVDDKPNTNKISIFGKPINTFSATSTNNPATIDSTKEANKSSLFMTSAVVPAVKSSSLSAEPSSKVNTVSKGGGASAETSSTASKTNANPFANVQLLVPDKTTTKSVSNNSASSESKTPSQQGDASTSVDKPKNTPNNSDSGLFTALTARPENSIVNSGISAGSTKISEKTDVDANKAPFSFGAATLAAKSTGATTTKATSNPFANLQLAVPSSTSGTKINASAKALQPAKAAGEKQPSSSSSYPPLSAKAPTPFSITSGVSSPATGVTGTGGDAEKVIQPEKPAQAVPATAAGKKAANAFDKIDAGKETTLPASSFEALLEEIGENFHGDEYEAQLAICDPTKSGNITRKDFVDWYVDLVEGDDTDDDESIDSEEWEERAEEEANAKEKFSEIGNMVDGAMSIPASEFGDLIESLGSAYCEEAHRSTLKKLTSSNGMIKEADFLAWYVDWLFAGDPDSEEEDNADDDTDKGKSEDKPSLSSIFQVDAGTWKCDMCSVPNKKDAKKCIACEAPRPGLEGDTDTSKDEKSTTLQGSIGSGGFSFGAPTVGGSIGSSGFSFGAPSAGTGSTNTATGTSGFSFGAPSAGTGSTNTATGTSGFSFGAPSASSGSTDTATVLPVSTSGGFTFGAPSTGCGTTTTGGFNFGVSPGTSISSPSIGSVPVPATAINAEPPSSSSYPPLSAKAPTPFSAVSANPNPPSGGANVGGGSSYPPIASKSPTPFSSLGNSSAQTKPPTSSSSSAYPPLSSKAPTPFSAASAKPSGGANAGSGSAYPPIASKSPTPFSSLGKPATEATKPPSSSSAYPPMSAKPPTPFSAASTKPSAGSSSAYPPIASKSPTPFSAFGSKSNTAAPSPAQASSSPTPSAPVPAPEKVGETENPFVQAPKSSGSVSSRAPAPAPYSFGDTFPKSSTLQSPLATSNPFATLNLTPSKTPDGKPMQSIFGAAIKPAPKFDFGSSQPKNTNPFGGTSILATKKPSEEKDSTASNGGLPSIEKQKATSLFGGTTTNPFTTKNTSEDKPNPCGPSLIAKELPPGEKQPSDGVATSATSAEDSAPAAKPSPFTSTNLFSANPSSGPSPFSGGSGGTSLFSTKAAPSKPFGFGAKASNFSNPMFGAVSPFTKTVSTPGTSPSKGATESETIGTGGSVDHRTRLLEFYKKYNPEKLNSVDATLEKYKGKEEELFKKLDARYVQSGFPLPGGSGPTCYLDFSIDGKPAGRVVVKLYQDKTPLAAENFRCLCTGEKGVGRSMKPLHYKNCKVHRLIPGFCVQLGDFTKGDGTGGESIYSPSDQHTNLWGKFVDEPFMRHARKGLLSMANNGPNQNGSQFFFTLKQCPNLDGKHVVFGEVVKGFEVVEMIEACETDIKNAPKVPVIVVNCGEISD